MKEKKPVYALYLSDGSIQSKLDKYDGRMTGEASICVVVVTEDGKIRNPSHETYGAGSTFDDFYFHAYWNVERGGEPGALFGFEAAYRNVFAVDLSKAERMVKLLRKVYNAKLPVTPTTFGQYCSLLASALGIKTFVKVQERGAGGGWSYDDNLHTILPISEAQHAIDAEVETVKASQKAVRA